MVTGDELTVTTGGTLGKTLVTQLYFDPVYLLKNEITIRSLTKTKYCPMFTIQKLLAFNSYLNTSQNMDFNSLVVLDTSDKILVVLNEKVLFSYNLGKCLQPLAVLPSVVGDDSTVSVFCLEKDTYVYYLINKTTTKEDLQKFEIELRVPVELQSKAQIKKTQLSIHAFFYVEITESTGTYIHPQILYFDSKLQTGIPIDIASLMKASNIELPATSITYFDFSHYTLDSEHTGIFDLLVTTNQVLDKKNLTNSYQCTLLDKFDMKKQNFSCRLIESLETKETEIVKFLGTRITGGTTTGMSLSVSYSIFDKPTKKTTTAMNIYSYAVTSDSKSQYVIEVGALKPQKNTTFSCVDNPDLTVEPFGLWGAVYSLDGKPLFYQYMRAPEVTTLAVRSTALYFDGLKQLLRGHSPYSLAALDSSCVYLSVDARLSSASENYRLGFHIDSKVIRQGKYSVPYFCYLSTGCEPGKFDISFKVNDSLPKIAYNHKELTSFHQVFTKDYHNLLQFDNHLIEGMFKSISFEGSSQMYESRLDYIKYLIRNSQGELAELQGRLFGNEDLAIDLDTGNLYDCKSELTFGMTSICVYFNSTNTTYGEILPGSKILDSYIVLVHKKSMNYSVSVIERDEVTHWTVSAILKPGETMFQAVLSPYTYQYVMMAALP